MGPLDVIFPPRCAGCGRGPWPFCDPCRASLVVPHPPWCRRCRQPLPADLPRCRACPPPPLATARWPFLYEGPARAAIRRLKFSGWREVAGALAAAMAGVVEGRPEAVCWVPLHRRRRARRGYDQAEALARALGQELGLPSLRALARTEETPPQARRPRPERLRGMRRAFRALAHPPGRILLVDDVLTTGATAAACAEVLVAAGAGRVDLVTAARALPGRGPARIYSPGSPSGAVVARGEVPR